MLIDMFNRDPHKVLYNSMSTYKQKKVEMPSSTKSLFNKSMTRPRPIVIEPIEALSDEGSPVELPKKKQGCIIF